MFDYDVCVIGTGRVGLPLGLSLIESGVKCVGVDVDTKLCEAINAGRLPFHEPGYEELAASRQFRVYTDPQVVSRARALVITVGTPLHSHIESDLRHIQRVLESVQSYLRPGQLLVLRSTVAPGTTAYVRRWIERHTGLRIGRDFMLAFSPERIAEGKAYEELRSLPQIIGAEDGKSQEMATELFSRLTEDLFHTTYVSAELVKLFNNIERYVHFALANQFALVADTFGADIYEIRHMTNYKYPRNQLAKPGLTAGTCLRKDFGMVNEWSPYPDMLLSAWKMNEYMPTFLVQHMKKRLSLLDRKVGILGYTFKEETDDIRDSLAPKLHRYILRELPAEIRVNDPYLPDPIVDPTNGPVPNMAIEEVLDGVDCLFVATAHASYRPVLYELARHQPDVWIADIWNIGGIDRIFYQARALHVKAVQEAA